MSARRVRPKPDAPLSLMLPAPRPELLTQLQRAWWAIGLVVAAVAALGFQALPPSRRLAALEQVNVQQDSLFARHARGQQQVLDTIQRRLGQLIAGQCVKERDAMARLLYGCPR